MSCTCTCYNYRNTEDCRRLLKDTFAIEASTEDCEVVRRVCEAVSTRAARLAATGVVTLVKKIDKLGGCTVAVDGTLYKEHPKFAERCVHCPLALSCCLLLSIPNLIREPDPKQICRNSLFLFSSTGS